MTLVDYFVNFLRPYANMPEFTTCVMKAMEELGHGVTEKSMYVEEAGSISEKVYNELLTEEHRLDPARFRVCSIECNE
jgi:hypothetical protein